MQDSSVPVFLGYRAQVKFNIVRSDTKLDKEIKASGLSLEVKIHIYIYIYIYT